MDAARPSVGQLVHFDASGSTGHDAGNGRIVGYRFDFGDGQGTGWQGSPLAEHAYASAGAFVASVTVVDNRDQKANASVTIVAGSSPPPPVQTPDVVPIQATVTPANPVVNDSVNVTAVILNRGAVAADAATLTAYDVPPNGAAALVGRVAVPGPINPSRTASVVLGPFVVTVPGNYTLRLLVTNVTPAEASSAGHELDLGIVVAVRANPGSGGGSGPPLVVSPLAIGLSAAALAAGVGAAWLLLRRPPRGPMEPPPPSPPDRSPPPVWPP